MKILRYWIKIIKQKIRILATQSHKKSQQLLEWCGKKKGKTLLNVTVSSRMIFRKPYFRLNIKKSFQQWKKWLNNLPKENVEWNQALETLCTHFYIALESILLELTLLLTTDGYCHSVITLLEYCFLIHLLRFKKYFINNKHHNICIFNVL